MPLVANSPCLGQTQCSAYCPGQPGCPAHPTCTCGAAWEVQLFGHGRRTSNGPCRLVLLDIDEHCLELWMCLWCDLQQGPQLWCDLHSKLLGKYHEFAHFPGAFMQCLQLEQDVALHFLQAAQGSGPNLLWASKFLACQGVAARVKRLCHGWILWSPFVAQP